MIEKIGSIEMWPEGKKQTLPFQKEEDLYGYEDAAPTRRMSNGANPNVGKTPRRSSLKGSAGDGGRGRRRHSITFSNDMDVKEIEPVSDLVNHPGVLWFQKKEYDHILGGIQDTVEEAKSQGDKARNCTRGLENIITDRYVGERLEATETVLDESRMQKTHKKLDAEYIRTCYRFHTADSQHRAERMAQKDQKEVEEYLKVTRKMCRRMSC
ncbi:MAG: hypothetical protein SGILL_002754 [Bacillariaceae sp.]